MTLCVLVDSREQAPWTFPSDVRTVRLGLPAGDYSLLGGEGRIALERKSLPDLVGSLTRDRDRFLRELEKLRAYDFAAVIVEADVGDVWRHKYVSSAHPAGIVGSCAALHVDFRIPFLFAGNAKNAADVALRLLRRWHAANLAPPSARNLTGPAPVEVINREPDREPDAVA